MGLHRSRHPHTLLCPSRGPVWKGWEGVRVRLRPGVADRVGGRDVWGGGWVWVFSGWCGCRLVAGGCAAPCVHVCVPGFCFALGGKTDGRTGTAGRSPLCSHGSGRRGCGVRFEEISETGKKSNHGRLEGGLGFKAGGDHAYLETASLSMHGRRMR